MNHSLASLIVACLALSAGPAVMSAQPARHTVGEVEILVNGTPQRRYAHDGRWYVEALKGKEYAIRLRNPFPVRVAVALSVDGLNTIDARHTTAADARKWVLAPYETVTISGWQTSQTEARKFEFTTEEKSYGQALGQTANLGTISAVFFKERVPIFARETAKERARRDQSAPTAAPAAPAERDGATSARSESKTAADNEHAATGMGQRTDHAVTQVWLDLEDKPAQTMNIRYEYRAQLVRLGILPARPSVDPLARRERGRGFEPAFSPVPPGY